MNFYLDYQNQQLRGKHKPRARRGHYPRRSYVLPLITRLRNQCAAIDHQVELTPKQVPVSFASAEEQADMYLKGASIGMTPVNRDLAVRSYNIDFKKGAGFIHKVKLSVTPSPGIQVEAPRTPCTTTYSAKSPEQSIEIRSNEFWGNLNQVEIPVHSIRAEEFAEITVYSTTIDVGWNRD